MTDNETTREKTFSEELPYLKERIKEVFDNYDNPNGYEDPLYIAVLHDSKRIVRKAEEEITRQQTEIERLQADNKHLENVIKNTFLEKAGLDIDPLAEIKAEAYKECLVKVKNYIKTHCNPYGKPDFDYDTSIKILNFIDSFAQEI